MQRPIVTGEIDDSDELLESDGPRVTPIELQNLYLKTFVSIEESGRMTPAGSAAMSIGSIVHVITAWNPGDDRPTRDENDEANNRLRVDLMERGLNPVRAVGSDPDSDHFEESWAVVGLSDDEARAIGAAYGQVAVFRLARGTQTVLACTEDWSLSRSL